MVHRDIKSSNILLDEEFNARISDFGLAKLLGAGKSHITTRVMGTFGSVTFLLLRSMFQLLSIYWLGAEHINSNAMYTVVIINHVKHLNMHHCLARTFFYFLVGRAGRGGEIIISKITQLLAVSYMICWLMLFYFIFLKTMVDM